jgi:carbonic anhydrase
LLSNSLLRVHLCLRFRERLIIIGCADMRVDPAHVLGIKPGEAVVMRNIGGRITSALLEQLGLLGRIGEVAGEIPGGGGDFHIIVLQHTDCGITRLAGDPDKLSDYFQIQASELKTKAVTNPSAAVAVDVCAASNSCSARSVADIRPCL